MTVSLFSFQIPLVNLLLLVGFGVIACLSVPAYFVALRPRRGTTEWMRRLDQPHFAPLQAQGLRWADALWAVLAAVCAAALRFLCYFFTLKLYSRVGTVSLLSAAAPYIVRQLVPCLVLAGALYLLLRTMLGGKALPAMLCAVLGGCTQYKNTAAIALLVCSLLCLYVWMSAPYDAPLFFHGFWLAGAGVTYAGALLLCWRTAWLAPFYLGAYVLTQVLRFRGGDKARRGKKLAASLLWTLLALLLGALLLWLVYCLLTQRAESPVQALRSFRFYRELPAAFAERIASLFHRGALHKSVLLSDAVVTLLGGAALLPLLHGAVRLRDGRCVFVLCLLPCLLCAWLISGAYLLQLPLLLALGRLWQIYAEREHSAYAVCFFCAAVLCFGAELLL